MRVKRTDSAGVECSVVECDMCVTADGCGCCIDGCAVFDADRCLAVEADVEDVCDCQVRVRVLYIDGAAGAVSGTDVGVAACIDRCAVFDVECTLTVMADEEPVCDCPVCSCVLYVDCAAGSVVVADVGFVSP